MTTSAFLATEEPADLVGGLLDRAALLLVQREAADREDPEIPLRQHIDRAAWAVGLGQVRVFPG